MRSLILAVACLVGTAACGGPEVDVPAGNDKVTSDPASSDLPAPTVQKMPGSYPYAVLAVRGSAPNAVRILIEGAGNPVVAAVQPVDNTFCIPVDLAAAPARYTLQVRSQHSDGRLSPITEVELDRDNGAAAPADAKLCDGSAAK